VSRLTLFDMDGTLCDDAHRYPLYLAQDWAGYFGDVEPLKDPVWPDGKAIYDEAVERGDDIYVLTARLERNRWVSEEWLRQNGFDKVKEIILRPEEEHDVRPPQFKAQVVKLLSESGVWDEVVLVDNDPDVVEAINASLGTEYTYHATWDSKAAAK
jgi:FMN phosphatase YigB (HAD superfamily)